MLVMRSSSLPPEEVGMGFLRRKAKVPDEPGTQGRAIQQDLATVRSVFDALITRAQSGSSRSGGLGVNVLETVSGVCTDAIRALDEGLDVRNNPITRSEIAAGVRRLIDQAHIRRPMVAAELDAAGMTLYDKHVDQLAEITNRIEATVGTNEPVVRATAPTPSSRDTGTQPPVEKGPQPRPRGDDPLAHWDRSIDVMASRNAVWTALTTAEKWGSWFASVREVRPGWRAGGQVFWDAGPRSAIAAVKEDEEFSLVDDAGNWLTFTLSDSPDGRVRVTLFEDRASALGVQGAFDRHNEIHAILGRLQALLEPVAAPLWEVTLTDGGDTGSGEGPFYSDETLFVTAGNHLHAVGVDGKLKWTHTPGWGDNMKLAAAASGLVVGHSLTDKVRAIDAASGEVRWEADPPSLGTIRDPVAFDGERVYAVDDGGGLCCLSAADGAELWSQPQSRRVDTPVVAVGVVYGAHEKAVALDADTGRQLWSSQEDVRGISPFVESDEVICITRSGVIALDRRSGKVGWSADFCFDRMSPPVADERSVYIRTGNHGVCSIARGTGETNWWHTVAHDSQDFPFKPPVVADGLVFCTLGDGLMHAIDAESGSPLWSRSVKVFSPPAVMDGKLFVLDYRRLYALDL
jgi:outer membrane protein assembly factor BamB